MKYPIKMLLVDIHSTERRKRRFTILSTVLLILLSPFSIMLILDERYPIEVILLINASIIFVAIIVATIADSHITAGQISLDPNTIVITYKNKERRFELQSVSNLVLSKDGSLGEINFKYLDEDHTFYFTWDSSEDSRYKDLMADWTELKRKFYFVKIPQSEK